MAQCQLAKATRTDPLRTWLRSGMLPNRAWHTRVSSMPGLSFAYIVAEGASLVIQA